MAKVNLQIRISPEMEAQLSELAPQSKSSFIREAIEEKMRREKSLRLEKKWIEALARNPQSKTDAEAWLKAEAWEAR